MKPHFLIIGLYLFTIKSSFAQYNFSGNYEVITSEFNKLYPGLSQNDVNCIIQDKSGILWIGTWDGLNRYDGYEFFVIRPDNDNPSKSISHRTINALYEDNAGMLWIGTDCGLNQLNTKTFSLRQFFSGPNNPKSLLNDTITAITGDNYGNIYVGTKSGLNKIDKHGHISHVPINFKNCPTCHTMIVYSLLYDKAGYLWIGTDCGLKVIEVTNSAYSLPENIISFTETTFIPFKSLTKDKNHHLWAGTGNGLYMLDLLTGQIVRFHSDEIKELKISGNDITALCIDNQGFLWAGTNGNGLNVIQTSNGKNFTSAFSFLKNFSNYYIRSLYSDRNGIVWIGTVWQGIIKYNRDAFYFKHYQYKQNDKKELNSSVVWSFCEDKKNGNIWIGTNNGINIFNPETETFSYILHNPKNPNSLSGNLIRDIIIDSRGIFWISTFGDGFNSYDPATGKFTVYRNNPDDPQSISCDYVWKVFEDRFGVLWIGTDCGLNILDRNSGKFTHYFHNTRDSQSISSNSIFSIYEDRKGNLWFSTYNGINLYNRKTDNFTIIKHLPGKNSLSVSSVFSVFEDRKGIIWIGTFGGGLNRYDPISKKFTFFTEKDGLANNIVYRIIEDSRGFLWMTTNHGVSRFDPKTRTFVNYDVKDGIQSYEFNHNAALLDRQGYIYFGGMNGFNRFRPEEILINKNIPSLVITAFKIFDKTKKIQLDNNDTIVLNYKENFFSIEFAALDFTNPSKNQYKYCLRNFKNSWTSTDAENRLATFTKVPPGTYFFTVIASNNDGWWNNQGITICIIIKPPFWKTWWFILVLIIFIILLIYLIASYYIFRIKKQHDLEKKMLTLEKEFIEAQQKALRYQMNPHFIFNSLNSIQNFILQKDDETAHIYLTNFSSLIRKILENSKHEYINLQEEIETIRLYLELESLRFVEKFEYQILISKDINPSSLIIPPMLIQPYLENAIWHGLIPKNGKGSIIIEFNLHTRQTLLITITDNGIGREKSAEITSRRKQHKPTGMLNIEKRLALMNRLNKTNLRVKIIDLKNDLQQPLGTRVEIYVQVKRNENFQ